MRGKNDTSFAAQEKKMLDAFGDLLVGLYSSGKKLPPELEKVGSSLQEMCLAVKRAGTLFPDQPGIPIPKERFSSASSAIDEKRTNFVNALSNALKNKKLSTQEPAGFELLPRMAELFMKNRTVIESRQNMVNSMFELISFQTRVDELKDQRKLDELKQHTQAFDFESLRPSFEDCARPDVAGQPEKVFRQMLWLSEHCSRTEYGENANVYRESLNYIQREIASCNKNVQLEYAKLINGTLQAYAARNKLTHSFCTLANSFANTPVGQELQRINPEAVTIPENIDIPQKTTATDRQKDFSAIASIYGKLARDNRSASGSFKALNVNLGNLLAMEERYPEGVPDEEIGAYNQQLSKAMDAANLYVSSHKTNPVTEKGIERIALARALQAALNLRQIKLNDRISALEQEKGQVVIPEDQTATLQQARQLEELAKVQRHIIPVRMVPKNPEYHAEPSKFVEGLRNFGNALTNALTKYFNFIPRLATETIPRLFASGKKKQGQIEQERPLPVPGHEGEVFKTYSDEELHGEVIDDPRRIPLMWEKPIPEDASLPPSVSFNFGQSVEGDDRTHLVGKNGAGHGCITLKYTKKDPFSGKDTRYAITMGMYVSGGFNKFAINAASYFNGLHIPARLADDSDASYSVSKTVPVTNYQINKILLAAQNYEKGGYNVIHRNCSTFVADMAKAGGIDTSKFIKPADFKGTTLGNLAIGLGSGVLTFFGAPLTLLARKQLMDKAEKTNLEYQNYGQKMVSPEVVKKLGSPFENARLKGYSPSHIAESIRHQKDYKLSGNSYNGELDKISEENPNSITVQNRVKAIQREMVLFEQTLTKHLQKNDKAFDPTTVEKIMKFCKSSTRAMESYTATIATAKVNMQAGSIETQKEMCFSLNRVADGFIDGLNDIFHNTLKGDDRLNIPFSHMASLAEELKYSTKNLYQEVTMNNPEVDLNRGNRAMIQSFFTETKAYPYKVFNQEQNQEERYTRTLTAGRVIGVLRVFGSMEEGLKQLHNLPQNGDETTALERKWKAVKAFEKAEKYFFSGKPLTAEDYSLAFDQLPKIDGQINVLGMQYKPSQIYQSEIFNRMLGNVCPAVRQFVKKMDKNNIANQAEPFYNEVSEKLQQALSTQEAKDSIKLMKEALLPSVIETLKKKNKPLNQENIASSLTENLFDQMRQNYLLPMFNDIGWGSGIKDTGLTSPQGTNFCNMVKKIGSSPQMAAIKDQLGQVTITDKIDLELQKKASVEVAHGNV